MIAADGELNAARALKEAAETISKSSTAMQLRYLQTLNVIAAERGSTILFPLPIDILGPMVCMAQYRANDYPFPLSPPLSSRRKVLAVEGYLLSKWCLKRRKLQNPSFEAINIKHCDLVVLVNL